MGLFASSVDVDDRYVGSLAPEQLEWVETQIGDAEALLLRLVPRLAEVNLAPADQLNAKRVVCSAVLRLLQNPSGWKSETEQVGPFSRTRSYAEGDSPSSGLFFTDAELAVFGRSRRRVGMVGVRRPWFAE